MPKGILSGSRKKIVVLVGLPGSGKSTYLERLGITPLSSDAVRHLLVDDATDQTIHRQVFAVLRYLVRHRIALGRPKSTSASIAARIVRPVYRTSSTRTTVAPLMSNGSSVPLTIGDWAMSERSSR